MRLASPHAALAAAILRLAACSHEGGAVTVAPGPIPPSSFPLVPAPSGRYLVDRTGAPVFMVGDAAQSAAAALTYAQWQTYVDTRVAQRFNTVNVNLIEHLYAPRPPADSSGNMPFTAALGGGAYANTSQVPDFTTPNDAYWSGVENKVAYALSRGVVVALALYMGNSNGNHAEGWYAELAANSTSAATSFGTYLANGSGAFGGFKKYPNVIWMWGADWRFGPDVDVRDKLHAIAAAVKGAGSSQLMSGDWAPGVATDQAGFQTYMDLQSVYAYDPGIASSSRAGYAYAPASASGDGRSLPALPAFMKETGYEGEANPAGDPASIRKFGWTAILSGTTSGYWYGHRDVWKFDSNWAASLDSNGAHDVTRLATLWAGLAWWQLVPSGTSFPFAGRVLVVAGADSSEGGAISAAQTTDGRLLLVYVPSTGAGRQSFTVDPRSMVSPARARWWDPTAGTFTSASPATVANTDVQAFTTPGANSAGQNDWVLVLDVTSS
jgi:Protein of unknown function (DUF4038)/Putative collagen-binding domain of a collagenase